MSIYYNYKLDLLVFLMNNFDDHIVMIAIRMSVIFLVGLFQLTCFTTAKIDQL
ncbi:MAG: hypothetical protein JWP71_1672 [Mucilaginibacter sp.]|nr:hypothetical protein [Mucilaginibacter sp.]